MKLISRFEPIFDYGASSSTFPTVRERRYEVQRSIDLISTGWPEVITFVGSGSSV